MPQEKNINLQKYLLALFATILVFGSGFFLAGQISKKQLNQLSSLQQNLRVDILSLETQFAILSQASCENLNESTLTQELYNISQNLTSVGNNLGQDHPQYLQLKKYYSILEIKHWLLLQETAKECNVPLSFIIYFYSDKKTCPKCEDQGYILTYFRKKYPFLRVYSFDYNLELAALETLKSIYGLEKILPAMVINDDVYQGFHNKQEIEKILEQYIKLEDLESPDHEATTTTPENI